MVMSRENLNVGFNLGGGICILELFLIKKPNYNDVKENTIPNSGLYKSVFKNYTDS